SRARGARAPARPRRPQRAALECGARGALPARRHGPATGRRCGRSRRHERPGCPSRAARGAHHRRPRGRGERERDAAGGGAAVSGVRGTEVRDTTMMAAPQALPWASARRLAALAFMRRHHIAYRWRAAQDTLILRRTLELTRDQGDGSQKPTDGADARLPRLPSRSPWIGLGLLIPLAEES